MRSLSMARRSRLEVGFGRRKSGARVRLCDGLAGQAELHARDDLIVLGAFEDVFIEFLDRGDRTGFATLFSRDAPEAFAGLDGVEELAAGLARLRLRGRDLGVRRGGDDRTINGR